MSATADLRALIRDIPDFPKPGILFKDITPLMADSAALAQAVQGLAEYARPLEVECVLAAEARGFLLGPALALALGAGFALARKPGKLPYETVSAEYQLEYGLDRLEIHSDAIRAGARVLVHDDLLATGGTARALCDLCRGSRWGGGGVWVSGRAGVPGRPRAAGSARGPRAAHIRGLSYAHRPTHAHDRSFA